MKTMSMISRRISAVLSAAVLLVSLAVTAQAAPLVSYGVSGSANDWTLNFSVANTLGGTNGIYFFGTALPQQGVMGSPTGWDPNYWQQWANQGYGGSSIVYNNNWLTSPGGSDSIFDGQTKSGFLVHLTTPTAPTSVDWFAYAYGGSYGGSDHFNWPGNPGFEGTAKAGATPIPAAVWLLGSGIAGLAGLRRKFLA